jgi:hypothetical protein
MDLHSVASNLTSWIQRSPVGTFSIEDARAGSTKPGSGALAPIEGGLARGRATTIAGWGSLTDAAVQTVDGDHDGRPLEHFHEPVQQTFIIVGSWLEVFFQNALRIPDGLNSQFLVAHWSNFTQQNRQPN